MRPALPPPSQARRPRSAQAPALIALAAMACASPPPEKQEGPDAAGPPPAAEYVGREACSTCHAAIARDFARTGMGRSLYPMEGPEASRYARFPDALHLEGENLHYEMFERDGAWYQAQYQLDKNGERVHEETRKIRYVIGSGNHSRSFVTEHDGRLYQMPVCWYPEADLWDLCPGYEISNQHFRREVDETCLLCHNGRVVPSGRFRNRFEDPFPHGIGCERCHGPGSQHVARWSTPSERDMGEDVTREDTGDPTIVNPARLSPERGIQVCMQCHLGDSGATERVIRDRAAVLDHRPGLPIQRFFSIHVFAERLPGRFGLTSQADRLAMSLCFERSGGAMQCTTCHNPHKEVYDLTRADPDRYNRACLTCHTMEDCTQDTHGPGANCTGCHMRRAEPTDQRYTTFLDHWIRRNPEEDVDMERSDFTLVPFFPDHDAWETDASRALMLGRAYLNRKTGSVEGRPLPWSLVVESLEEAVRRDPDAAAPRFFLGKAELERGRVREAADRFRGAIARDPRHVASWQELGTALLILGAFDEAAEALTRALEIGPRPEDEAAVLNELARVELERSRPDKAIEALDAALAIEPLGYEVLTNRGLAEAMRGDPEAAARWYLEALRQHPGHPRILEYLAGVRGRAGI